VLLLEVNPRIQVEHTVTECATGIDLVKAQIRIADGARIGDSASGVPTQGEIRIHSHALQCRVTTEDPENNFTPDYGRITAYRSAAGFGVRLDAGTAYAGAIITRWYEGDHLGADAGRDHRAHASGVVGVSCSRCDHQSALPRPDHYPPVL
jgi:pyruvate carboxylase